MRVFGVDDVICGFEETRRSLYSCKQPRVAPSNQKKHYRSVRWPDEGMMLKLRYILMMQILIWDQLFRLKMASAYTAGGQGICLELRVKTGQRWKQEGRDRSRGNLRQPVLRWALGSQLEFAAIVGGFHNIGKRAEVR
jgi:hypothetical protein